MTTRYGRLNRVEMQPDRVTKTCVVKESLRPRKLLIEGWAMNQARLEGIKTPKVISYRRTDNEVLVMERVPGNSLGREVTSNSIRAFSEIGKQLACRRGDHIGYGWIDPVSMNGVYSTWAGFLRDYVTSYCTPLVRYSVITTSMQDRLLDSLAQCKELTDAPSALVHRDIKPGNIVWGENGAYLIDWENVMLGDPFFDLCVYRCRYGSGRRWDALSGPAGIVSEQMQALYLAVALVGIIDFCITYKYGIRQKSRQLCSIIERL